MRLAPLLILLASCTVHETVYVYPDSGHDSGQDAGTDAAMDIGTDVARDIGTDTAPPCECSSGACCDGCYFRPSTYACITNDVVSAVCESSTSGNGTCGTSKWRIKETFGDRFCNGWSASCSGTIVPRATAAIISRPCSPDLATQYWRCIDVPTAHCIQCP